MTTLRITWLTGGALLLSANSRLEALERVGEQTRDWKSVELFQGFLCTDRFTRYHDWKEAFELARVPVPEAAQPKLVRREA